MEQLQPSQGLTHFLTGHGPYPEYLCRFNLKEDNLCECGEVGTPEHVVLECPTLQELTQEERVPLQGKTIQDILGSDLLPTLDKLAQKVSKICQDRYNQARMRN